MADMEVEKSSTVDAAPAAGTPMKTVPETLLKKRKRDEQWAINRKQLLESGKNKNSQSRKVIFKRAEQFIREYRGQVRGNVWFHKLVFYVGIYWGLGFGGVIDG